MSETKVKARKARGLAFAQKDWVEPLYQKFNHEVDCYDYCEDELCLKSNGKKRDLHAEMQEASRGTDIYEIIDRHVQETGQVTISDAEPIDMTRIPRGLNEQAELLRWKERTMLEIAKIQAEIEAAKTKEEEVKENEKTT